MNYFKVAKPTPAPKPVKKRVKKSKAISMPEITLCVPDCKEKTYQPLISVITHDQALSAVEFYTEAIPIDFTALMRLKANLPPKPSPTNYLSR